MAGKRDAPAPTAPARRRSTRDRPAKAPLGLDAVVDAALGILRRDGLEAVTMRAVARELDTGPASLYVYVRDRDELVGVLFDRVFATVERPTVDPARWREQLVQLCLDALDAFAAHPNLATLALGDAPVGPSSLDVLESFLTLLLAGGVPPQAAAWAADTLFLLVAGNAVEREARATGDADADGPGGPLLRTIDAERHPTVAEHAALLVRGGARERFLFGVDAVLDGVTARDRG